jgi:hypothetical protein
MEKLVKERIATAFITNDVSIAVIKTNLLAEYWQDILVFLNLPECSFVGKPAASTVLECAAICGDAVLLSYLSRCIC